MSEQTENTGIVNENIEANDGGNIENEGLDNQGQDEGGNIENPNTDNGQDEGGSEFYGAPENYDFKDVQLPEGYQINEALAAEFAPLGKELNLSQQSANKLAEFLIKYQQSQTTPERLAEYKKQEQTATKLSYEKMLNADKEIGGNDEAKRNAYIDVADVGYSSFASDELKTVLHELSLDFHPAVIKHFYRLGKLCGDDKLTKTNTPVQQQQTAAQILFGTNDKD